MTIILQGILKEGMIYAIMALGVYITYKILDFPDLSVDGTFPLGSAVTAMLLVKDVNPYIAMLVSMLAGAVAGMITGIIHVKFKVRDLLSGIIMMTALYSINLRIAGSANVALYSRKTIFGSPLLAESTTVILILAAIVLMVKIAMDMYMNTKSGLLLRAVGDNETLVTSIAKDKGYVKIVGLSMANALAALSGSVYCQQNGFFEISSGTGTIVIGLASVIIGTRVLKNVRFVKATTAVIFGSLVYKACVAIAIAAGLESQDLKLIIATLFLAILLLCNGFGRKKVKGNA